jgi:hypothetical protein
MLTMRPTGLRSGVDAGRPDWTVFSGAWAIGRIYEQRGGPDSMRWFWSFVVSDRPTEMRWDGHAPTLEAAKAEFEAAWWRWLRWARLREEGA